MHLPEHSPQPQECRGFTLPAILALLGGLLILAVAVLVLASLERNTAEASSHHETAKLAVRSALEEIHAIVATETANDDFLVIQSLPANNVTPDHEAPPYLFLARGQKPASQGAPTTFRYLPLFSSADSPDDGPLSAPEVDPLIPATPDAGAFFQTLPYYDQVRAQWIPILDRKNRMVARYAYWVEDLQSRVDPAIAGNLYGPGDTHARVGWPFPASGVNPQAEVKDEPVLNQIALFAIDPEATDNDQSEDAKQLIENRNLLLTPGSGLAAAGVTPPLIRLTAPAADGGTIGDLADQTARTIERGVSIGTRPYLEQALIPYSTGIDPDSFGEPQLNLNEILDQSRADAVIRIAQHIRDALPDFELRKGGFPDNYLRTLAASMLDYADEDNDATVGAEYRGIDAYPLVSEYAFRSTWENVYTRGDRKYISLSIAVFVELWNMTSEPVEGSASITYQTGYSFQIPPNPNRVFLRDLGSATHNLVNQDGYWWFPGFNVSLQPNEYRLFRCGTIQYEYDVGPSDSWFPSPLILSGDIYGNGGAGYQMKWNGQWIDKSRGGIHRNDSHLLFPSSAKRGRHVNRLTVPGHSYNNGGGFLNNMGDPRICYYASAPQDANIYPQNFSPNRRNIREGSVYTTPARHSLIFGRVLPSEWPDGGHDSPFGTANMYGLFNMASSSFQDDHRIEPDDPRFFTQLPDLSLGAKEAPVRLSSWDRFFSPTELGHIHDPVMWEVRSNTNNLPETSWGDVESGSSADSRFGGGNTLRIGRPEHPRFDQPGLRSSHLLDLFHAGRPLTGTTPDPKGPLVAVEGHVNVNTTSREALRLLIAGKLRQDPAIREFANNTHVQGTLRFPAVNNLDEGPDFTAAAGRIADAIIAGRPYASAAEMAAVREKGTSLPVFGNPELLDEYAGGGFPKLQWTDAAAEEVFARTWEASTVRSRNFRVWIVGQSVTPTAPTNGSPEVLAESHRSFQLFADPGERDPDGKIDPSKLTIHRFHETDF